MTRVVVIGAGIIGTSCAYFLSRTGVDVVVIDRAQVGAGTTSRGEGNVELSDKAPGPELDLMQLSREKWLEIGEDCGVAPFELQPKGTLVVATSDLALKDLQRFANDQARAGVEVEFADKPNELEPNLSPDLPGAVHYPQDMQVQPVLAAASLLRTSRSRGATFYAGEPLVGAVLSRQGQLIGVRTPVRTIEADVVINAAGTWAGEVGRLLGAPVPISPRRGFVLVTEPLPRVVRRKVYSADYVANVASSESGLETSCVVEGTEAGTVLIGASRERVGYDTSVDLTIIETLAAKAIRLFPMLGDVQLMRVYRGFRPYSPDHLPIIGADSRVPGVYHACGHEGAGVGLSPATGYAISCLVTGQPPELDLTPFSPSRLATTTLESAD